MCIIHILLQYNIFEFHLIDILLIAKATKMKRNLSVDSKPCHKVPSRSPSPSCETYSDSDYDDVYIAEDDTAQALSDLKKVIPLSQENEYIESRSSYVEHDYEYIDSEDDEYDYVYP